MIKEIKIENFKSIESLNLELGRLNVFIGANGSGKSNILEGIAFGSVALMGYNLDNGYLEYKGVRFDRLFAQSAFRKEKKNEIITIFKNTEGNFLKVEATLYPSAWRLEKSSSEDVTEEEKNNIKIPEYELPITSDHIAKLINHERVANLIDKFNLKDFLIFAPENSILRNSPVEGHIMPLGVKGEGLFNHLVELLKKESEILKVLNENLQLLDWFNGFEVSKEERRIKIKDQYLEDGLRYFDQRSANEGFLYLLFYLTLFISDETPKFFAIDNIDNAMNPKMGSELIHILSKLAKKYDKQVILTTHNPAILDGLDLGNEELDQRLFAISRNKKGHTQAIRVPHRESDERLSYRFIRGSIGGLPKNF